MKIKSADNDKDKRDILLLLTQDLDCPSGLGRYYPISKNLAKHNLKIAIAALHSNYSALDTHSFIREGVKVDYVSQMHVKKLENKTEYPNIISLLWVSLKATWKLFVYTLKNPAKTIIIGKPHPMNSLAGLIGGRLIGAKIILDCDDYEAESNFYTSAWQKMILRIFENSMPKLVDRVTTNTMFNQKRIENLGVSSEKIYYLPNGVDFERFQNIDNNKKGLLSKRMNLETHKIITFIGSLSLANHPVDLLIKAFKVIIREFSSSKLVIVGGGKDIDTLKSLVRKLNLDDDVIFIGKVPPDIVPYYYSIADISVDPVYDTDEARGRCPLKMFESWTMETSFITADVGDRKFLIGSAQSGLLSEPGNYEDLAEKILLVLKDEDLASELIKISKERVDMFYWNNLVSSNLEIFINF
jgi:glycosyltransferase involved in cell wall biosynthesis